MQQKRINIGLFVSDLENDFDSDVCKGVMAGAKEVDANLMIFPGRYLKGQYNDKERSKSVYQYNTLFSYVNKDNIDVLLVLLGTIGTVISEREKKIFLDMYQDIPVILLASEKEGYSSITFDNKSGFREGIEDLIVTKGCKNIGMVSGPKTSGDAIERLDVYKEVLEKYNLEYDESKVVYGNFSEYTEDIVSDLLDRHSDLDAIVFANDHMAIGGYKAMKKRGIRIGSDIYVMGFDDSPSSTLLIPNLTTVRADAVEIGRLGAIEAVSYLATGVKKNKYVKTSLIKRDSSGDTDADFLESLEKQGFRELLNLDIYGASKQFVTLVIGDKLDKEDTHALESSVELVKDFFTQVISGDVSKTSAERVVYYIEKILGNRPDDMAAVRHVFRLLDSLKDVVAAYMPEKLTLASSLLYDNLSHVTVIMASNKQAKDREMNNLLFMSNSIAKDMLIYGEENDMSYYTVNDKLTRLGCKSAYLYSFKTPYINKNSRTWHDWQIPSKILLKSYYENPDDIIVVKERDQEIDSMNLFTHKFMPKDRRYTMLINNIFINEEQLGMLLCEIEHNQLFMMSSLLGQLSSAFKIINMLKIQAGIQKQLKISLDRIRESNEMLETISKSDELTGIYNRRGFFEMANELIDNEFNCGKRAILVFADLDNLKTINDKFGHDDGDFAIKKAADILKESFRTSDVVARIGGDEFVAFAISDATLTGQSIQNRISKFCDDFNEHSDKDYYVEMSVGFVEFLCDESVEIEKYLDMADEMLYQDKKEKRQNVIKEKK